MPKTTPQVSPADFERVTDWLNTTTLVERETELKVLVRGVLAGVNTHMVGAPGVAKSLTLREFVRCISDARFFEKVVHAQMPADALIGPYDMENFAKTGHFARQLDGYIPRAHFAFIDEIVRANGPTTDALLPLMNSQERVAEHNGGMVKTDLRAVVTASNSWFDADNQQAQAFSDRVTLMLKVEDIRADASFQQMIQRDHVRRLAEGAGTITRPTVSLEQFDVAQQQVREVALSPAYMDAIVKLRRGCTDEGLIVSPRRWIELTLVARANAWMAGRTELLPQDLTVCEHGLWRDPADAPTAHALVLDFHGRFERLAHSLAEEAVTPMSKLGAIRPTVEDAPVGSELPPATITEAINISRALAAVRARVVAAIADGESEDEPVEALRETERNIFAAQVWLSANSLPDGMGAEDHKRMAEEASA